MLTLNDGRSELWQWDTNRAITVDADCSQVHFSNKVFGRSIDVDVVDGFAIIPDILLQTDKELTAWAFVGTAENGYTKISKTFKVNKRNKPADYVFTPPEQTTLQELVDRLDEIEESQDPDAIKNAVEDYLKQNPVQSPVQSVNGYIGEVKLTAEDVGAISEDDLQEATNEALAKAKASGEFDGKDGIDGYTPIKGVDYFDGKDGQPGANGKDGQDYVLTEADKQEIAEQAAELVEVTEGSNVNPVAKTAEMTQPVGVDSDGKLFTKPSAGSGGENTETMTDFAGYTGMQFYDNGNVRAYNPIVNTTAWNGRCRKVSALMQKAAESALLASTEGVMAHECALDKNGFMVWVENVAGTAADVPTHEGITCVKGRTWGVGINYNFPSAVPSFKNDTITTIAQQGDTATDTIAGETITIAGGVGYSTMIDNKVLCGYVPSYAKLCGMTCTLTQSKGVISVSSRDTWTLTIDGVLGEYNYSRLPSGLTGATLHPSNQIAKIGSTYYRADVVPNNGFVVFSSTDLINWTYIGHATFPEGFDDKSATEACCGAKRERLYVAVRQAPESACLYLAKMNADMYTINSCVALPDCGSKPCFTAELNEGSNSGRSLFLATAPADRYGCRVYNIPTDYSMTHIYPVFELHGVSCNYPFIFQVGFDPYWVIIAGTNGAQANKKGVSLVPAAIYSKIAGQVDIPADTDNIVHTAEGAITFGELYSSENEKSDALANALTFTGAVEATYDGSAPVSIEIPSGGGGGVTWKNVANETLDAEASGFTTITLDEARTISRIRAYAEIVGTGTNTSEYYAQLLVNGKVVAATQNAVTMTAGTKKYVYIDVDVIASGTLGKGHVQTADGDSWSSEVCNKFATDITSTTEVSTILLCSRNGWGTLGVGSKLILDIC